MNQQTRKYLIAGAAFALGCSSQALAEGPTSDEARATDKTLAIDALHRTSNLGQNGDGPSLFGLWTFRYDYNSRDEVTAGEEDQTVGFSNRFVRLGVKGGVGDFGYKVMGDFGSGGTFTLVDAFGTYDLDNGWTLKFGQMKAPFSREYLLAPHTQLGSERSVTDTAFRLNRTQGIGVQYDADQYRFQAQFNDGAGQVNTAYGTENADFGLTARFDYLFMGDWSQWNDYAAWDGQENFAHVGGAVHYQSGGSTFGTGSPTMTDFDMFGGTIDGSYESDGWGVSGAFYLQSIDSSAAADEFQDMGFQVQGSWFAQEDWELFGRYDIVIPDDDRGSNVDNFSTVTVGANHYFIPESHAARFTFEVSYFLDEQNSGGLVANSTNTGVLASTSDAQFNIRAQMQLAF